jgi:hypothetical protein
MVKDRFIRAGIPAVTSSKTIINQPDMNKVEDKTIIIRATEEEMEAAAINRTKIIIMIKVQVEITIIIEIKVNNSSGEGVTINQFLSIIIIADVKKIINKDLHKKMNS